MLTASDVAHLAPLRLVDGERNGECQAYVTVSQHTQHFLRQTTFCDTSRALKEFLWIEFLKLEESKKKNTPEVKALMQSSSAQGDCQLAQC